MKKIMIIVAVLALFGTANAQDSVTNNFRLRLGVDASGLQVGYADNGTLRHTDYALFSLRPDMRFTQHWGLALSAGYASSFHNNLNDGQYNPLAHYHAICANLLPYYEWQHQRWTVQLGMGVSARVRHFIYTDENCTFGMTGAFGAVIQPRCSYLVTDHLRLSAALTLDRTFLDILEHYTLHPEFTRKNGALALTVGAEWEF